MPLEYYFMLAGLVLLLIEFVVPGFGVFGVSGMVCLTVGGFYVWAAMPGRRWCCWQCICLVLVLRCCACIFPRKASIILCCGHAQKNSEGYTGGKNWSMLVGKRGTALTTLRPAGTIWWTASVLM